jgi:hypothetical protein
VPQARTVVVVIAAGLDRRRIPPWGPIGRLAGLGELARRSVAFGSYRVPTTVPAAVFASLLTGLSPRAHGLEDPGGRLRDGITCLQERVKDASGRTALFTAVPTSFAAFGFARGWDRFEAISPVEDLPAVEPYSRGAAWLDAELERDPNGRRLLVVHARGAHPPWDVSRTDAARLPPEEYDGILDPRRGAIALAGVRARRPAARRLTDADWIRMHALEEAALAREDEALASLVRTLERRGEWDSTLFMFAGDVPIGDAPELPFDPAPPLAEDNLLAPLLVKFPGGALAAKEALVSVTTTDLAHTLLAALRLAPAGAPEGLDLHAAAHGIEPLAGRPLIATLGNAFSTLWGHHRLDGELGRPAKLCALDVDPACLGDARDERPLAFRLLWQRSWEAELAAAGPARAAREPAAMDPATAAALVVWGH